MTDPSAATMSHQFAMAFPTLIGRFEIPNSDNVNAGLLRTTLERERSDATHDYANVGGWHSQGNLLEWPGEHIAALRNWIIEALRRTVQATAQLPEVQGRTAPQGSFRISAWANVSRRGNYHRMHNHPGSAWSGVYYVSASSADNSLGGVLEFYDPRQFTEMVDVPGSPYGQRMHIRPKPGLLVVFPGWLYHFVHPNVDDDVRVSIAFNASWLPS